jgi:Protein of unknown function (DUF429)
VNTRASARGDGARLVGCDFTSRPTRRKPIILAHARLQGDSVRLTGLQPLESEAVFEAWLAEPLAPGDGWTGGFDLPFGLPRELVETLGWPTCWIDCVAQVASLSREDIRRRFAAFCASRPAGRKFAHRATDGPAGSSPSMKWVNPPVAFMLHAGLPRLIAAGVHLPRLHAGDARRVALEAYPGLLAREVLGRRSYKSDERARQTPERLLARRDLIDALEQCRTRLGLRLRLSAAQRDTLADDATGDRLDAVLCAIQAGWARRAHERGAACHGLPPCDPLEGWIVTAESDPLAAAIRVGFRPLAELPDAVRESCR